MIDKIRFRPEQIHQSVFIAPGAIVLGDVTIGADSSVWYNAVIRGDSDAIQIGMQTNVQDLCLLHADAGFPCVIGNRVTVGHAAIVHGATVEDDVLVGMKAVIMNGARIGTGSIIAVGALITEGTVIPPRSVVMGSPGKIRRQAEPSDGELICHAADHYVEYAKLFRQASDK